MIFCKKCKRPSAGLSAPSRAHPIIIRMRHCRCGEPLHTVQELGKPERFASARDFETPAELQEAA